MFHFVVGWASERLGPQCLGCRVSRQLGPFLSPFLEHGHETRGRGCSSPGMSKAWRELPVLRISEGLRPKSLTPPELLRLLSNDSTTVLKNGMLL